MKVLLALRGRPGLGHVIPGLSVGLALAGRGHELVAASYDNGARLLAAEQRFPVIDLGPLPDYDEWGGLRPYEDAVRRIAPIVREHRPDLLLLGGEYLLAPLGRALGCPTVMMFNPEIMEPTARNDIASRVLGAFFESCVGFLPLQPSPPEPWLDPFDGYRARFGPEGPFTLPAECGSGQAGQGGRVLIGNGGGVSFPRDSRSYGSTGDLGAAWLAHTILMTETAIEASLADPRATQVDVYSALPDAANARLARRYTDPRLSICGPDLAFHARLDACDLVISRGGGGYLADLGKTGARAIIWPLPAHDEQIANARRVAVERPGTWAAQDAAELRAAVGAALGADRAPRPVHEGRAEMAAKYLEGLLS